jgi:uncharacterized Zn-binding protein involved in type VI secretion
MRAARFDDPIGHTFALEGLIGGGAVGAVAGVVAGAALAVGVGIIAALTAPLSVPALIGAALLSTTGIISMIGGGLGGLALGATIGEFVGSLRAVNGLTSRGFTGNIASGSPDVFINSKKAARIGIDTVPCFKDPQVVALIAMGSRNVFINDHPAARVDDKVSCGAIIREGSANVYIGGGQEKFIEVDEEVPGWVPWAVLGTGAAGALLVIGAAAIPVLGVALGVTAAIAVVGGGAAVGYYVLDPVFRWVGRNVGEYLHDEWGFNVLTSEFENGGSIFGGLLTLGLGAKIGGKLSNLARNRPRTMLPGFRLRRGPKHGQDSYQSTEVSANWGIGPLRPSARPLLENEGVLIDASHGLQSRKSGLFKDVMYGRHGDPETKYLWTVDNRGVNVALEKTPFPTPRGNIVHTNISSEAAIGGEAWFGPDKTVTINAGSGRFGDGAGITPQQWDATVKLWESLGYKVNPIPFGSR